MTVPVLDPAVLERAAVQEGEGASEPLGAYLSELVDHLHRVLADGAPTTSAMAEVMAVYNAAAHVFLFLEETGATTTLDALRTWRRALHEDAALDARLLSLLRAVRTDAPDAERARLEHVGQLEQALDDARAADERTFHDTLAALREVRGAIDADKRALLRRLGVAGRMKPDEALRSMLSQVDTPATRSKLRRAWHSRVAAHRHRLVEALDELVAARRAMARRAGFDSVTRHLHRPTRLSEESVGRFLDQCVEQALDTQRALRAEVAEVVGPGARVADHVDFLVDHGAPAAARLPLHECLAYIFQMTEALFGLRCEQEPGTGRPFLALTVHAADGPVGRIYADVWEAPWKSALAHHTTGVRNRTAWPGAEQLPVAFLTCRFRRPDEGPETITLRNMRSLLHEFGHALHHLLIRERFPYQSGIEYLPPERREILPSWCENWIHHDSFTERFAPRHADRDVLERSRWRLSMDVRRTAVERAALSWLDFEVHRAPDGGVQDAVDRMERRFGVQEHCAVEEILEALSRAAYVEVAGASYMYPWGRALGAAAFEPYRSRPLGAAAASGPPAALSHCFDRDEPSATASPEYLFACHADARLEQWGTHDR